MSYEPQRVVQKSVVDADRAPGEGTGDFRRRVSEGLSPARNTGTSAWLLGKA